MSGYVPDSICALKRKQLGSLKVDCNAVHCSCCDSCTDVVVDPLERDPRAKAIKEIIKRISFNNSLDSAARAKAKDWIINDDEMKLGADSHLLEQRYILAVFYFSLNGDKWSFNDGKIWLSKESSCDWSGVGCDRDGVIQKLELRE